MKYLILRILVVLSMVFATAPSTAQIVKRGTIVGKSVTWTTGSVSIIKKGNGHEIRLGKNFKTKRGPSLWIYLGNEKPEKRIGKLKSTEGAQSYILPKTIDPAEFSRIYIHCVPFNATFGIGYLK